MIRLAIASILLVGCSTSEKTREVQPPIPRACPQAAIELRNGTEWTDDDGPRVTQFQKGCKLRYGETSCVFRIIKTGVAQYRIICKDLGSIP